MELKTTIIVSEEVAEALENLYSQMDSMNWDYEMFAEACFAIACDRKNFEWGLTKIDIVYKGD